MSAPALTRDTLRNLRPPIDAALAKLGAELGFVLKLGNASFDPDLGTFTFKLEGRLASADTKELSLLKLHAAELGLDLKMILDKQTLIRGEFYVASGLQWNRNKGWLVIGDRHDGKRFLFRPRAFGGQVPIAIEADLSDVLGGQS